MNIGFITSILDGWTFEEAVDIAHDLNFSCLEVACWPHGKAERKYGGVTHIDVQRVLTDDSYAQHLLDYAAEKGVRIASLGYYPNNLDSDLDKRAAVNVHLMDVIRAAAKLGVGRVTTFIGRVTNLSVEKNLELLPEVWNPILGLAEELNVQIGIENCPMLFDESNWPGGQNLMTSPENWDKVFEVLPSKQLGLAFDPSHFIWQHMDYCQAIHDYADKIFHVHFKDIKLYPQKLARVGVMAYPLDYMEPKIPGYGDVDWGAFCSALTSVGFDGDACIEVEDHAFEGSREQILNSLKLSRRYMSQFVI